MSSFSRNVSTLVPALMAVSLAAASAASLQPAHAGDGARCEIRVSTRGGTTTLEGVVFASAPVAGSYRLSVGSTGAGGGSDIDQSGNFSAKPGEPVNLGVVSLGGPAGTYSAELTIKWNGGTSRCSQRAGGRN